MSEDTHARGTCLSFQKALGFLREAKTDGLKNLLAMTIDSDINEGGESRGSISRNCENAWGHSVYSAFERFFCLALRGHSLPFQWVGGECAGSSQRGIKWRHDRASCRNFHLVYPCHNFQGCHTQGTRGWRYSDSRRCSIQSTPDVESRCQ
jgi:hypothetical protein